MPDKARSGADERPARGVLGLRLASITEWARASLFLVPTLFVVAAALLAQAAVSLDFGGTRLPLVFTSTVESARALVSTVAAATVTVAGIAFSVSLLVIQLASSQYSPRVVHSLFRDPVNKRLMGVVVGTFSYCLVVLRAVRGSVEDGGDAIVPNLSVALAVLFGIASILAVVYFIDHSAHSMDVSEILQRITDQTVGQAKRAWPLANPDAGPPSERREVAPDGAGHTVRFKGNGWVEEFDTASLLDLVDDGGTVRLETAPGRYAVRGTALCTVWPRPGDEGDLEQRAHRAVQLGKSRTMRQDLAYGARQLADVGLKALSPGVNDPTTAQEAIFHLGAVMSELLRRDPPTREHRDDRGRRLLVPEEVTHADLVHLAFDELRRAAAPHPAVCVYLLEALRLLSDSLTAARLGDRVALLHEQARLVVAGAEQAGGLDEDVEQVREAWRRRFAPQPARP